MSGIALKNFADTLFQVRGMILILKAAKALSIHGKNHIEETRQAGEVSWDRTAWVIPFLVNRGVMSDDPDKLDLAIRAVNELMDSALTKKMVIIALAPSFAPEVEPEIKFRALYFLSELNGGIEDTLSTMLSEKVGPLSEMLKWPIARFLGRTSYSKIKVQAARFNNKGEILYPNGFVALEVDFIPVRARAIITSRFGAQIGVRFERSERTKSEAYPSICRGFCERAAFKGGPKMRCPKREVIIARALNDAIRLMRHKTHFSVWIEGFRNKVSPPSILDDPSRIHPLRHTSNQLDVLYHLINTIHLQEDTTIYIPEPTNGVFNNTTVSSNDYSHTAVRVGANKPLPMSHLLKRYRASQYAQSKQRVLRRLVDYYMGNYKLDFNVIRSVASEVANCRQHLAQLK